MTLEEEQGHEKKTKKTYTSVEGYLRVSMTNLNSEYLKQIFPQRFLFILSIRFWFFVFFLNRKVKYLPFQGILRIENMNLQTKITHFISVFPQPIPQYTINYDIRRGARSWKKN